MYELADGGMSVVMSNPAKSERGDHAFYLSATLFQAGLFVVTFEQVRPFGIEITDYFLFCSFLVLLPTFRSRVLRARGSGILLAGALIFSGAMLSLLHDADLTDLGGSFARLVVLYGLFAPLALIHSKDIRKNLLFLTAGIAANCAITIVQAWIFPEIVSLLSINPLASDPNDNMRYQGLTQFPVTLGLTAALAMLIGFGLLLFEKRARVRWGLGLSILICVEGALLSGSRTFLAASIPGLLVFGFLLKQHRRAVVRTVLMLVFLWGVQAILAPGAVSEYSGRIGEVGLGDVGRLVVAAQAVVEISQRPILGWGFNHFKEAGLTWFPGLYGDEPQPVHVTLFQYWYGAGLLGAMGFLALFVLPAKRMLRVLANPVGKSTNAVRLGLAFYVSVFVIINLGPYLYNRYIYLPMFLFAGFTAHALDSAKDGMHAQRNIDSRIR